MLESAETQLAAAGDGALASSELATSDAPRKKRIGVIAWIAIIWLVIVVGAAILAPILPIKDPINGYDYLNTKAGLFKAGHIFGTDDSGNDVLSRVIWGAQASLLIGVGSVLFGTLIGGFLGLFAGFKGGTADTIISAFFNIFLAFPQLVLALTLVSVFSPPGTHFAGWSHRILIVILAIGIVSIPILGRITRANTLAWSQREFVMAARAQGATDIARHVPRGTPERRPRDALDCAAECRGRDRARRRARDLRSEHPGAEPVVGQHDPVADQQPQLGPDGLDGALGADPAHGALAQLPR